MSKLGFKVWATSIETQKIDSSTFQTFGIIFASFQVEDKLERACFFQEIFLVTDTSIEVIFGISFLSLSDADMKFTEKKLI